MQNVNAICVVNDGGFDLKFMIVWNGGNGGWSSSYPNPGSQTVQLSNYNIPPGTEVWIEVHADGGVTRTASQHVIYEPSSNAYATYQVTGACDTFKITLQGS